MNFDELDKLYYPKRQIKNSKNRYTNVTGFFKSPMINDRIYFESLSENLCFCRFEQDVKNVLRYYPQPVEIPIKSLDNKGNIIEWVHVPDCLVFYAHSKPLLCEVKYSKEDLEERQNIIKFREAKKYAQKNEWEYQIFVRKDLSKIEERNLSFLMGYRFPRFYYKDYKDNITDAIRTVNETTILELAIIASNENDYRFILPLIFHMIFLKILLLTDLNSEINYYSLVRLNDKFDGGTFDAVSDFCWNGVYFK